MGHSILHIDLVDCAMLMITGIDMRSKALASASGGAALARPKQLWSVSFHKRAIRDPSRVLGTCSRSTQPGPSSSVSRAGLSLAFRKCVFRRATGRFNLKMSNDQDFKNLFFETLGGRTVNIVSSAQRAKPPAGAVGTRIFQPGWALPPPAKCVPYPSISSPRAPLPLFDSRRKYCGEICSSTIVILGMESHAGGHSRRS
jgi:hypothetical protein